MLFANLLTVHFNCYIRIKLAAEWKDTELIKDGIPTRQALKKQVPHRHQWPRDERLPCLQLSSNSLEKDKLYLKCLD